MAVTGPARDTGSVIKSENPKADALLFNAVVFHLMYLHTPETGILAIEDALERVGSGTGLPRLAGAAQGLVASRGASGHDAFRARHLAESAVAELCQRRMSDLRDKLDAAEAGGVQA